MKINVSVDRSYMQTMNNLAKKLGKGKDELEQDMAYTGARSLASSTVPFGLSNKSKRIAEKAIYKDINRAFASRNEISQTKSTRKSIAYRKALAAGDYAKAARVGSLSSVSQTPSSAALSAQRGRDGRVGPGIGRSGWATGWEQFKESKLRGAGTAKAGWLQAANDVKSGGRIPVWLRKNGNLGSRKITRRGIIITNHVNYASNATKIKKGLQFGQKSMARQYQRQITKEMNRG